MTAKPATAKPAAAPKAAPAPKPAPAPRFCGCGCGKHTVRPEAAYLSGHDARHAGNVGRALLAATNDDERAALLEALPTPALKAKAEGVVATAARKEAERAARKVATAKAKEAARAAYAAALAAN